MISWNSITRFVQDRITGMLVSISDKHFLVHEGKLFTGAYSNLNLDIVAPITILFKIGAKDVHYTSVFEVLGGVVTLDLYKDPTITANGTALPFYNNNLDSTGTALFTAFHTPTTTANGTVCAPQRTALGSAQGAARSGSSISSGSERILKANTNYLAVITTNTDNTLVSYVIEAYEEDID